MCYMPCGTIKTFSLFSSLSEKNKSSDMRTNHRFGGVLLRIRKAAIVNAWIAIAALKLGGTIVQAQDLTPRAYVVAPVGSNAITIAYSFLDGSVFTDPTVPITDFKARYHAQILSYSRSFNFLGRSAMVTGALPY